MLTVIILVLWISTAIDAQAIVCPVNESEVFHNIENESVPETRFELYTRKNMDKCQYLTDATSLLRSNFDARKPTVLACHGHYGSPTSFYLMKNAYLRYKDCNFIAVNWTVGASEPNFFFAIRNLAIVARFIARNLEEMKKITGCKFSNFHVIGWSLGGQLVGFVGKSVWSEKIGRITALDPAGICFTGFSSQHKLHISDAKFVDVILATSGIYILNEPTGHLTFAPDGGKFGRGCGDVKIYVTTNNSAPLNACSHVRPVELFTSSLGNPQCLFVGYVCSDYDTYEKGECYDCGVDGKSCAAMGIHAEKYAEKTTNKSVMMYLDTTFTYSFCLFQYHVEVKLSRTLDSTEEIGVMFLFINKGEHDEIEILLQSSANEIRRPERLIPGEKYTYLVQSHIRSVELKTIHFLWVSYQCRKSSKLYIQCVTMVPMNNLQTNRDDITLFATGNNKPFRPDTLNYLYITYGC